MTQAKVGRGVERTIGHKRLDQPEELKPSEAATFDGDPPKHTTHLFAGASGSSYGVFRVQVGGGEDRESGGSEPAGRGRLVRNLRCC
ncbi:hypothetical protein HPB50_002777 [Hyalomma asiaticum]|uniref:Uncharacterized protein n=1 Tax=Hyalomma asiaticum TaxID=266040 RepID=A0ACB7S748_HYAAI|nr:hypothetical protein HPB50_002777 [Hyalomma asiaticum]